MYYPNLLKKLSSGKPVYKPNDTTMRKILYLLYILATAAAFTACKKEDYLYRDVSSRIWLGRRDTVGPAIYISDSSIGSFKLLPATAQTDTLYVTANVTGITAATDRPFTLKVLDGQTNVTTADYTIGQPVVPANSFMAQVPVIVKKNVPGLDLTKERAILTLLFVPNEHFLYATPGTDTFRIVWVNYLSKPNSWTAVQGALGNFSQAKYKFILDFYGPVDFERYRGNTNLSLGLQSALKKALRDYNNNPANQGRPEGWPYLDDNGTPLTF